MLKKQNKIIIVDNLPRQLEILGKSFFENGLGVRTFVYDQTYDEPLENVRIAFFDINLTEKTVDVSSDDDSQILKNNSPVFNDLANAINQYISKTNGPYILIFWTANKKVVDAFKLYMQDEGRGFSETASPILTECIDKTVYNGEGENSLLSDAVMELLNKHEKIKFLLDLEENSQIAGQQVLNRIYSILPKEDAWGESDKLFANLDKALSKIAASALGFEHAKFTPQKGVYEGLIPILNYELLNLDSSVDWSFIVSELMSAQKINDISSTTTSVKNELNTLYHIEEFTGQTKDTRGCVIEINKNDTDVLNLLGIENFEDWMSKLLALKQNTSTQQQRSKLIVDKAQLIAVEISAACDFSNKKNRINKYIIGILTSNLNDKIDSDVDLKIRPESCYHLGGCCFKIGSINYHIWLNLNYVFGAKPDDTILGQPQFVLKKEIMDMLGNKYASHISRIGITSL